MYGVGRGYLVLCSPLNDNAGYGPARGVDLALWSHRWCQKVLCGVKSDFFGAR